MSINDQIVDVLRTTNGKGTIVRKKKIEVLDGQHPQARGPRK
jgi:hypothetical protein